MNMRLIIIVGIGSFLGGVLRYLLVQFTQSRAMAEFPFGTLLVNVIGSFLIGLIFGLAAKFSLSQEWRFFLMTGALGGFTTFSAFSLETANMLRNGQLSMALLYILGSLILTIPFTFLGIYISR